MNYEASKTIEDNMIHIITIHYNIYEKQRLWKKPLIQVTSTSILDNIENVEWMNWVSASKVICIVFKKSVSGSVTCARDM